MRGICFDADGIPQPSLPESVARRAFTWHDRRQLAANMPGSVESCLLCNNLFYEHDRRNGYACPDLDSDAPAAPTPDGWPGPANQRNWPYIPLSNYVQPTHEPTQQQMNNQLGLQNQSDTDALRRQYEYLQQLMTNILQMLPQAPFVVPESSAQAQRMQLLASRTYPCRMRNIDVDGTWYSITVPDAATAAIRLQEGYAFL